MHKGRNITDRLDESLHAGVRKVLRQAWQQDDAAKAERLLRNLARRLEHDAPGVSGSILEGLGEILTVIRLGLPPQLRRSLACTNAIENAIGTVRTVQRNVKRWRNAEMAVAPINPICRRNPSIPGLCRIASPTCARPFELSLPWSVRLSSAARRCILRTLPCDSSLPP